MNVSNAEPSAAPEDIQNYMKAAPQRRPALRILSYVSLGIVLMLIGYGAVRGH